MNEIKYLDQKGLEYLWSKLSLEDYPNNELLIAVINAIDEGKANKEEVPTKVSQLENDSNFTSEEQVEALYKRLNSNTVLAFYCIEEVTINQNGVTTVYPANSNVEVKFLEGETFEIIPTSDNSIMSLSAFPGAISTFYPWLEGVKQFSNILFDMNSEEMYTKWNQGNQGAYQVQYAQYVNCIFWSDNPYISELSKRTNYTLYYSSQLPLCYSSIPDNTFKAFYLAFGVNNDPNWGNKAYRDSFAKATYATQVFSYYGARTIGIFGHDDTDFNIVLPKDCRGLMSAATAIENAGTFDAEFVTNFGAKSGSWRDAFGWCSSLRNLYIKNLKVNLNVSWSPLNYDSISFIISEATNTNAITISVSPYTYNLLRQVDFDLAASKNITIELITTNYIEDKRLTAVGDKINNGATLVNSNELSAALHEAQFYTDNAISQVDAVSYSEAQELTNEQKIQARDNIAAQAKLEGSKGQVVGFNESGEVISQGLFDTQYTDVLTWDGITKVEYIYPPTPDGDSGEYESGRQTYFYLGDIDLSKLTGNEEFEGSFNGTYINNEEVTVRGQLNIIEMEKDAYVLTIGSEDSELPLYLLTKKDNLTMVSDEATGETITFPLKGLYGFEQIFTVLDSNFNTVLEMPMLCMGYTIKASSPVFTTTSIKESLIPTEANAKNLLEDGYTCVGEWDGKTETGFVVEDPVMDTNLIDIININLKYFGEVNLEQFQNSSKIKVCMSDSAEGESEIIAAPIIIPLTQDSIYSVYVEGNGQSATVGFITLQDNVSYEEDELQLTFPHKGFWVFNMALTQKNGETGEITSEEEYSFEFTKVIASNPCFKNRVIKSSHVPQINWISIEDKPVGTEGQIIGFDANGNMVAQDSASVETDDTLTIVGVAADAKAAGDKITEAYSTAVSAQNTANSANTAATNAQTTANSAKEDAEACGLAATLAMPGALKFDGNLEGREFVVIDTSEEVTMGYVKLTDEIPPASIIEFAATENDAIIGYNYMGTYIGQRAQLTALSESLYMIGDEFPIIITTKPFTEDGLSLSPGIYSMAYYVNMPFETQLPFIYGSGLSLFGYSFEESNGGKYFEKRTETETIHYGDTLTWDGKVGDRWSFSEDATTIVHLSDSTPPLDRVADITTVWSINGEEQIPTSVDIDTNINGVAELYFRMNDGANMGIFIIYQDNYPLFSELVLPKKGIYTIAINSSYLKSITLSGYDFIDENSITREVIKTEHLPEALRFGSMPTTYGSAKVVNGVLTWDGNTDCLDGFNATETVKYVKVLSTWPTVFDDASNNVTGTVVVSDGTSANFTIHSNATGIWGSNGNDGDAGDGTLLMFTNDEGIAMFEKDTGLSVTKGVYLCSVSNSDTYISSISLDGYKFIGEEIAPIDKKYLPEALQFGSVPALCGSAQIVDGALTWDGNTSGLDSHIEFDTGMEMPARYYKVSEAIPEVFNNKEEEIIATVRLNTDESIQLPMKGKELNDAPGLWWGCTTNDPNVENPEVAEGLLFLVGGIWVITSDEVANAAAADKSSNIIFNNVTKGIYILATSESYVSSVSLNKDKFSSEIITKIDEKYLPEISSGITSLTDLGVNATAEELNYMVGAKDNIQEQLADRAMLNHTHNYISYESSKLEISSNYGVYGPIAYGNGIFMATTTQGMVFKSTDGITWTSATWLNEAGKIVYGNGLFVVFRPYYNSISYSMDGSEWTTYTMPFSYTNGVLAYLNDKFIFLYDSSNLAYSLDGINWTTGTLPASDVSWTDITYGNGVYVACGSLSDNMNTNSKVIYSADGINWSSITLSRYLGPSAHIKYGDGKFVLVGSNCKMTSTNGKDWTEWEYDSFAEPELANDGAMAYGANKFVVVKERYNDSDSIIYSVDGINWTIASGDIGLSSNVIYADGKFIAVKGNGDFAYSYDGINWMNQTSKLSQGTQNLSNLLVMASAPQNLTLAQQSQACNNIGAASASAVNKELSQLNLNMTMLTNSLGALTNADNYIADANAVLSQGLHCGIYVTNSATLGSPYKEGATAFANGIIISYANNTSYGIQMAMPAGSDKIFMRRLHSGNIQVWKSIDGSSAAVSNSVVVNSSTPGSTKKFELTIDDSGTITATEITN